MIMSITLSMHELKLKKYLFKMNKNVCHMPKLQVIFMFTYHKDTWSLVLCSMHLHPFCPTKNIQNHIRGWDSRAHVRQSYFPYCTCTQFTCLYNDVGEVELEFQSGTEQLTFFPS